MAGVKPEIFYRGGWAFGGMIASDLSLNYNHSHAIDERSSLGISDRPVSFVLFPRRHGLLHGRRERVEFAPREARL